ncbi:SGNH/GDSL hydrolase family protein [Hydrogenophaga aromaticivorans]|uniref:SGNH/GDSL hydrolase family protein n=1 Tax=Hydrogenophaga aromaticivorans TaxID=2610898 RepID=UPI001B395866|nr:SGNH/GDSL hydrolase family protein [Hydrogenophaga aromaticivorans]MBQ0917446.1 SGNH/GDSL hydrolase family protein [Hydrogenophaga aromaticivorans]
MRNIKYIGTKATEDAFFDRTQIIWTPGKIDTVLDEAVATEMLRFAEFEDAGDAVGGAGVAVGAVALTPTGLAIGGVKPTSAQKTQINAVLSGSLVEHRDHLSRFDTAMSQSLYSRVGITICGNSITQGYYANDVVTPNNPVFEQRGFCGQLRDRFALANGTVGIGAITFADSRCTLGGGANLNESIGLTRAGGARINAVGETATLTLTEPATEIWVHGWWESDAKCEAWTYSVDGAADETASISALGSDKDYTVKITGLSNATHTLVIKPAATPTKQVDIAGFSVFSSSQSGGIVVNRFGKGGGYLESLFYPMSNVGANPRSNRLTFGRTETDLAVLAFGANEASVTGEGVAWTPTRYRTALLDLVNYLTDTYGCSVLLASLVRQNPTQVGSYGEEAFYDIHREIANDNQHVAHFDLSLSDKWATYSAASAAGLLIDNVHPKLIGHSDIASLMYRGLMT